MMHGFGFGGYGSFGWVGMIINLVFTLVVIIGIIWLIVWLVRKGIPGNQEQILRSPTSPKEILQTRYARGEITREQYLEILEDLK